MSRTCRKPNWATEIACCQATELSPLAEYWKAILSTGYEGYWTLELLYNELWKKPPVDVHVARIGLATMRRFAGLA